VVSSPCPVRAAVSLPCGATVRATCYLWGTAPPPRAPHPTRRCYAVASQHFLPRPHAATNQ
jgi:hypothetical protein